MRKIILGLIFAFSFIFLVSSISAAQISFNTQPNSLYNLGDIINLSLNIITTTQLNSSFIASIICGGVQNQIYQQYLTMAAGQQQSIGILVPPLSTNLITTGAGICQIKASLDDNINDYVLTNQFQVSNSMNLSILSADREFYPGQQIAVGGSAIKQDGQAANGFVEINVTSSNNDVIYQSSGAIINGYFNFNFSLPNNLAAGQYLVNVFGDEEDSIGNPSNTGNTNFNILVYQVPTNLELVLPNFNIAPGQSLIVTPILHDQTGVDIVSPVNLTIINSNGVIIDQKQATTGEDIQIPISFDDPPYSWNIEATSQGLNNQANFSVGVNKNISLSFLNRTLLVTNIGNVPYTNVLLVAIGNQTLNVNVSLPVGASKKYILTAPNGNYSIWVLTSNGEKIFNGDLALTGNAVNVQNPSGGIGSLLAYPLVWVFVVLILIGVAYFYFRKARKKSFMNKVNLNRITPLKNINKSSMPFGLNNKMIIRDEKVSYRNQLIPTRNKALLSSSIHGDKQGATIIGLEIKNFEEIRSKKGGVDEVMRRIGMLAEEYNASVYENNQHIFFILAPVNTRTFKNERTAIDLGRKIKDELEGNNRLLKQKIAFGLSVHYGTMVANLEGHLLSFMSLGSFLFTAKKLASFSDGDVFISKEIRDRAGADIKTEKHFSHDIEFYTITEIRNREKSDRFIQDFLKKQENQEVKEGN